MVKKHLFTSIDVAQRLNERVRDEIDARLFLTANFNLPKDVPPSASGKYYQYVQTLYRFAIDTGCAVGCAYSYLKPYLSNEEMAGFDDLRNDDVRTPIGCASLVRTCLDHNVSEYNGLFEQEEERAYKQWLASALDDGKETPETEDDYDRLCVVLETMADLLVDALDRFITEVTKLSAQQKQEIVERWINDTLRWYTKSGMRYDIYLGQMALLYEADEITRTFRRRDGGLNKYSARTAMEIWLRNFYFAQPDCPTALLDKMNNTSPIKEKCATKAFFGAGYEQRLRQTLDAYEGLGLLPQDLMQQDIADRLEQIPKTV